MFKETSNIRGIFHEYSIEKNILIYLSKSGGIIKHDLFQKKLFHVLDENKFYRLFIDGQNIVVDDANGTVFILDFENFTIKNTLKTYGLATRKIFDKKTIIVNNYSQRKMSNVSIINSEILWSNENEIGVHNILNKWFIYCNSYLDFNSILKIDYTNGGMIWKKDLLECGKIVNLLCVFENYLWLITQKEENYWFFFDLIALNVQTGEIEKQIEHKFLFGYTTQFIEEKQSIISLRGNFREDRDTHFLEIDINNGEIIRIATLSHLQNIGLSIFEFTVHESYIYFTASSIDDPIFAKSIGILNYQTLELLWWENVDLKSGAYFAAGEKPVISEGNLYILDTMGTLHIFEKETIE